MHHRGLREGLEAQPVRESKHAHCAAPSAMKEFVVFVASWSSGWCVENMKHHIIIRVLDRHACE